MDPEEIENRQFLVQLRGYARDEVEAFREEVAQEIKILRKQLTKANSDLAHANSELGNTKSQLAEASAQLAEQKARPAPEPEPKPEAPEAPAPDRASMFHLVGQETERILLAAEEAAEQIHDQAVKEAAELMADTRTRVERTLAEFEAARRAAEEDFAGIRDSRSMVASQLEDIRRRLEETISRLRVPVELPGSKPASRFRPQPDAPERAAPQPPAERRPADLQEQRQREIEAAKELQARQTAHRAEASRREEELKAVQAEAEQRARIEAERQARERSAAEVAARKAQQAADLHAAVAAAQEADRVQAERQKAAEAERLKAEEAAAAARAREEAEKQKARRAEAEKAEAEKAEAEKAAREQADRAAQAEKHRAGKAKAAEQERARKPAPAAQPKDAAPPGPKAAGEAGSSLDELLAEIRRKREEEEHQAAQPQESQEPAAAPAAATAGELSRRSEALGDLPAQTARRLKRLLQEEHNDLLDRLRTQKGKGDVDDNLAPHNEQLGRFVSGLSEALGRAFSEGRRAAGSKGSADPSAVVSKLVTRQVMNPLRGEIAKAIQAGLEAQESASSLSERANDVFRVWKGVRTQLLGEGITYAAYHQGLVDVWGAKPGTKKSWVFSADEQECPNEICRRNADAGPVALKSPFPSGHLAPPAHGGCNCTLAGS